MNAEGLKAWTANLHVLAFHESVIRISGAIRGYAYRPKLVGGVLIGPAFVACVNRLNCHISLLVSGTEPIIHVIKRGLLNWFHS
jgi:hypothetical protein